MPKASFGGHATTSSKKTSKLRVKHAWNGTTWQQSLKGMGSKTEVSTRLETSKFRVKHAWNGKTWRQSFKGMGSKTGVSTRLCQKLSRVLTSVLEPMPFKLCCHVVPFQACLTRSFDVFFEEVVACPPNDALGIPPVSSRERYVPPAVIPSRAR